MSPTNMQLQDHLDVWWCHKNKIEIYRKWKVTSSGNLYIQEQKRLVSWAQAASCPTCSWDLLRPADCGLRCACSFSRWKVWKTKPTQLKMTVNTHKKTMWCHVTKAPIVVGCAHFYTWMCLIKNKCISLNIIKHKQHSLRYTFVLGHTP